MDKLSSTNSKGMSTPPSLGVPATQPTADARAADAAQRVFSDPAILLLITSHLAQNSSRDEALKDVRSLANVNRQTRQIISSAPVAQVIAKQVGVEVDDDETPWEALLSATRKENFAKFTSDVAATQISQSVTNFDVQSNQHGREAAVRAVRHSTIDHSAQEDLPGSQRETLRNLLNALAVLVVTIGDSDDRHFWDTQQRLVHPVY